MPYLNVIVPGGSMYAFVGADTDKLPGFDDQDFAMELLETQHVLVAPGSSFNVDYHNYFRVTILPEAKVIDDVFRRMENVLDGSQRFKPFAGSIEPIRRLDLLKSPSSR